MKKIIIGSILFVMLIVTLIHAATGWNWTRYKINNYQMDGTGMQFALNDATGAILQTNCGTGNVYFYVTDKTQIAALLTAAVNHQSISIFESGSCTNGHEFVPQFYVYPQDN